MSSEDGINSIGNAGATPADYAAALAGASEASSTGSSALSSVATVSAAPQSASALESAVQNAVSAIMSESRSGISVAALGAVGNFVLTAERLIATMPPNLGTAVDVQA